MKLFLEATIDSLATTGVSNLTQKHLNIRYENDFNIDLAAATYYKRKDFLELIFFANSTFGATDFIAGTNLPQGKNGQYTLCLRFYKVKSFLENADTLGFTQLETALKDCLHKTDVKFYSDAPDFYFQGAWESLDKEGMSIYKFSGVNGKGIWDAKHYSSGGITNPRIHLTKHLAQIVNEIDDYIRQIAQILTLNDTPH